MNRSILAILAGLCAGCDSNANSVAVTMESNCAKPLSGEVTLGGAFGTTLTLHCAEFKPSKAKP